MHRSLMTYIAGTAHEQNITVDEAIVVVRSEFLDDPQATSENEDMLEDCDLLTVSNDDKITIHQILAGFRMLWARLQVA